MTRILVVDGHPDPAPHLGHALAEAYMEGARDGGYEARLIRLADAQFSLLRSVADFAQEPTEPSIVSARGDFRWAQHIVLIHPLWLGAAPALLRAFLEQIARGNFLAEAAPRGWKPSLKGRTARQIVTMGMPPAMYRLLFGAHGVKALAKSVLWFAGVKPVRTTLIGVVDADAATQTGRIERVRALGAAAR